jgi:hypothetical protein
MFNEIFQALMLPAFVVGLILTANIVGKFFIHAAQSRLPEEKYKFGCP